MEAAKNEKLKKRRAEIAERKKKLAEERKAWGQVMEVFEEEEEESEEIDYVIDIREEEDIPEG